MSDSLLANRYLLDELLGMGGMGEVWQASDQKLGGRQVAVKLIKAHLAQDPIVRERFLREVETMSRLPHGAHVVQILDLLDEGERFGYVMELLPGRSLRAVLDAGPVSVREALQMGAQVAAGLDAMHGLGIVHRDIKPSNIWRTEDGLYKVLDLGIAKIDSEETLTLQYQPLGTYGYMSPEQIDGTRDIDARSDLFSLGIVLYLCLSGERPFGGGRGSLDRTRLEDPVPLDLVRPGLGPEIVELVDGMLRKAPQDRRPHDLIEVRDTIQRILPALPSRDPDIVPQGYGTDTAPTLEAEGSTLGRKSTPTPATVAGISQQHDEPPDSKPPTHEPRAAETPPSAAESVSAEDEKDQDDSAPDDTSRPSIPRSFVVLFGLAVATILSLLWSRSLIEPTIQSGGTVILRMSDGFSSQSGGAGDYLLTELFAVALEQGTDLEVVRGDWLPDNLPDAEVLTTIFNANLVAEGRIFRAPDGLGWRGSIAVHTVGSQAPPKDVSGDTLKAVSRELAQVVRALVTVPDLGTPEILDPLIPPDSVAADLVAGVEARRQGDLKSSQEILRRVLTREPDFQGARIELIRTLVEALYKQAARTELDLLEPVLDRLPPRLARDLEVEKLSWTGNTSDALRGRINLWESRGRSLPAELAVLRAARDASSWEPPVPSDLATRRDPRWLNLQAEGRCARSLWLECENAARLALEQARALGSKAEEATARLRLGVALFYQGQRESARQEIQDARDLFVALNQDIGNLKALVWLANLAPDRQSLESALDLMAHLSDRFRDIENRVRLAETLTNRSTLHLRLGDLERSVALGEESLDILQDMGDHRRAAAVLITLAAGAYFADQLERSATFNRRALESADRAQDLIGRFSALNNLGEIALERAQTEDAERFLAEAWQVAEIANYQPGKTSAYWLQAKLAMDRADHDEADRLLVLAQAGLDPASGARALLDAARVRRHQGALNAAWDKTAEAAATLRNDPGAMIDVRVLQAQIQLDEGQAEKAAETVAELDWQAPLQDPRSRARRGALKARLHLSLGQADNGTLAQTRDARRALQAAEFHAAALELEVAEVELELKLAPDAGRRHATELRQRAEAAEQLSVLRRLDRLIR